MPINALKRHFTNQKIKSKEKKAKDLGFKNAADMQIEEAKLRAKAMQKMKEKKRKKHLTELQKQFNEKHAPKKTKKNTALGIANQFFAQNKGNSDFANLFGPQKKRKGKRGGFSLSDF